MVNQKIHGDKKLISIEQIMQYADASGDHNPLHLDETFASKTMFGKRIAHGMFVLSLIAEIMNKSFPNEWNDSGSLNIKFRAPVFLGDEVVAIGELRSSNDASIIYSVKVINQDGIEVITGDAILSS